MRTSTSSLLFAGLIALFSPSVFAFEEASSPFESARADIPRFAQVADGLFRGGRPNEEELRRLRDGGVKLIINLENSERAVREEAAVARRLGLQMISIPMEWSSPPRDADVQRILALMRSRENGPVFLHCKHGEDRTGMMVGFYRVAFENRSPGDAYAEMLSMGFHPSLRALDDYFKRKTGLR